MPALLDATLTDAERQAIDMFIGAARERFGDELVSVWLFGSRARGERPSRYSDIDLFVVTNGGRERDLREVSGMAYDAAAAAGADPALISTVVMSPERVRDRRRIGSFFLQEVDRDKIVLYGEP